MIVRGPAGADFTRLTTTPEFALGESAEVIEADGKTTEYVYIKALAALNLKQPYELPLIVGTDSYQVDTVLSTAFAAALATVSSTAAVCIPQVTFASGQFGWAAVAGHMECNVRSAVEKGDLLYTTSTNGSLGDSVTHAVRGLTAVNAQASDDVPTLCFGFHRIFVERLS